MGISYNKSFNVIEVFEQNSYQKILMATKVDNPNDVAVINIFKKSDVINSKFVGDLHGSLKNMIFFEEDEYEVAIATDYKEGMSLSKYLDSNKNMDFEKRVELSEKYLKSLAHYDLFDNCFKNIFTNENQIIIDNSDIIINELIMIKEDIDRHAGFNSAEKNIGHNLKKLLSTGNIDVDQETAQPYMAFVDVLINGNGSFGNISELLQSFLAIGSAENSEEDEQEGKLSGAAIAGAAGAAVGATVGAGVAFAAGQGNEPASASEMPEVPSEEIAAGEQEVVQQPENLSETPSEGSTSTEEFTEELAGNPVHADSSVMAEEEPQTLKNAKEIELENLTFEDNAALDELFVQEQRRAEKKKMGIAIGAAAALVALIAVFMLFNPFAKEFEAPTAAFDRIMSAGQMEFKNTSFADGEKNEITQAEWIVYSDDTELLNSDNFDLYLRFKNDGTYVVQLKVMDNQGKWSEPYIEEFDYKVNDIDDIGGNDGDTDGENDGNDKLDKYIIGTTGGADFDNEVNRSGSKSIKIDFTGDTNSGTISLNDVFIDNNTIISLWAKADTTEPVKVTFKGYSGNTEKFKTTVTHSPIATDKWEMIEARINTTLVDRLEITFESNGNTLWVDDIDINSYK